MACPADGVISQMGPIRHGELLQAKGFSYSLFGLLVGDAAQAKPFLGGQFAGGYLSQDYHQCIYLLLGGERMVYVPSRLFSVNAFQLPISRVCSRNERVVCWFSTDFGPMVVVLVRRVGHDIHTVWQGQIAPEAADEIVATPYAERNIQLAKGAELGHFELGSTRDYPYFPKM